MGKPEGKKRLGKHRSRWEDNINMDIHKVGYGRGGVWIESSWLGRGTGSGPL